MVMYIHTYLLLIVCTIDYRSRTHTVCIRNLCMYMQCILLICFLNPLLLCYIILYYLICYLLIKQENTQLIMFLCYTETLLSIIYLTLQDRTQVSLFMWSQEDTKHLMSRQNIVSWFMHVTFIISSPVVLYFTFP
jgi:hypothetical protein